jgi:hypothetical protein
VITEVYKTLTFSYELPQNSDMTAYGYKMRAFKYVTLTTIAAVSLSFIYVQSIPLITFTAVFLCTVAYVTMAIKYRIKALEIISLFNRYIHNAPVIQNYNVRDLQVKNAGLFQAENSRNSVILTKPIQDMFDLVKRDNLENQDINQFFIENPNIDINQTDKDNKTILFRAIYARNANAELITQLFCRNGSLSLNLRGISLQEYQLFFINSDNPSMATQGILRGSNSRLDVISYLFEMVNKNPDHRIGALAATTLNDFVDHQNEWLFQIRRLSLFIFGRDTNNSEDYQEGDLITENIYEFLYGPILSGPINLSKDKLKKVVEVLNKRRFQLELEHR